MLKGIVVAGDFREYVIWLQENEKNRSEYHYVDGDSENYEKVRGLDRDTHVYMVGTYRDRFIHKVIKSRFHNIHMDTVNLGFDARPDSVRNYKVEDEVTATSEEDTYQD